MRPQQQPQTQAENGHQGGRGRETRVLQAVVALVDNLLDDFDPVDLLTELTEQCAELLDVASAGLLLAGPDGQLHLMTATSGRTHDVELLQLQADEGPCLDCYRTGHPVSVADLSAVAQRWPRFVPAAVEAGFASVHAVPMRAAGTVLGALGLFGTSTGELNSADVAVGQTLAHVASVAILQGQAPSPDTVKPQVRSILAAQIVVEQAKGLIRERLDVSVQQAQKLLRSYAHTHTRHLTDVSRDVVSDRDAREIVVTALRALHSTPDN